MATSFTDRVSGLAPDGDGWRKAVGGTELRIRRLCPAVQMSTAAASA